MYTQQDAVAKLKISKSAVSKFARELVDEGRLVEIEGRPDDIGPVKRYSSFRMVDLPENSITMDADYLMEQFLDMVRRHFPAGGYDNDREITMRMERMVKAIVNFPLITDERKRAMAVNAVKDFSVDVISDLTDIIMLLKAFAAIDLNSRAVHPILTSQEAKQSAAIIGERVNSGLGATQQQEQDGGTGDNGSGAE